MAKEVMGFVHNALAGNPEILYNAEYVGDAVTLDTTAFTNSVCKAGTPIDKDGKPAATTGGTKGVWTVQITTAFEADEVLTVNGVNYTCAAEEDVDGKEFAGANAAAQVASLAKMVVADGFAVTAVSDKLTFTQDVPDAAGDGPTVTKTATTGAIGSVAKDTDPVDPTTSNAYGILLVDVYQDRPQGTVVIGGYIHRGRAEANYGATYDAATMNALKNVVFMPEK